MHCPFGLLRVFVFLLASSSVTLAEDSQIGEGAEPNAFTDDFLTICGSMVLSGDAPTFWTSYFRTKPAWPAKFDIKTRGDEVTCTYYASYKSDVSYKREQERAAHQPLWLENPEIIGALFDEWIQRNGSGNDFRPNTGCLASHKTNDTITEKIYSQGITIGDTGRVIIVEITRLVDSYLDPDLGFSIQFYARSSNFRVPCA